MGEWGAHGELWGEVWGCGGGAQDEPGPPQGAAEWAGMGAARFGGVCRWDRVWGAGSLSTPKLTVFFFQDPSFFSFLGTGWARSPAARLELKPLGNPPLPGKGACHPQCQGRARSGSPGVWGECKGRRHKRAPKGLPGGLLPNPNGCSPSWGARGARPCPHPRRREGGERRG